MIISRVIIEQLYIFCKNTKKNGISLIFYFFIFSIFYFCQTRGQKSIKQPKKEEEMLDYTSILM